jgi:transcription antitermination protein NusB
MAARSKARKRALDILFESEIRGEPVLPLLDERSADDSPPVASYAAELVRGVYFRRDQIDQLLAEYAQGWTLERMPAVDRNILRIGTFELLWQDEIPDAVAISEAVHLARDLSTEGSPSFVNGLLARLLTLKPGLADADPDLEAADSDPAEPSAAEPAEAAESAVAAEPAALSEPVPEAAATQRPGAEPAS